MARVSSNGDEIARELENLFNKIDFTIRGAEKNLGEALVEIVANDINELGNEGKGPDGAEWTPNEKKYAAYKARRYDVHKPGELGGQMLSEESLKGQPLILPDQIDMVYGTGKQPPPNSRSGVPLREHERKPTDREKADWFTDGGRPFYELNDAMEPKLLDAFGDAIEILAKADGWAVKD
jgi:hypothetical protein